MISVVNHLYFTVHHESRLITWYTRVGKNIRGTGGRGFIGPGPGFGIIPPGIGFLTTRSPLCREGVIRHTVDIEGDRVYLQNG